MYKKESSSNVISVFLGCAALRKGQSPQREDVAQRRFRQTREESPRVWDCCRAGGVRELNYAIRGFHSEEKYEGFKNK